MQGLPARAPAPRKHFHLSTGFSGIIRRPQGRSRVSSNLVLRSAPRRPAALAHSTNALGYVLAQAGHKARLFALPSHSTDLIHSQQSP